MWPFGSSNFCTDVPWKYTGKKSRCALRENHLAAAPLKTAATCNSQAQHGHAVSNHVAKTHRSKNRRGKYYWAEAGPKTHSFGSKICMYVAWYLPANRVCHDRLHWHEVHGTWAKHRPDCADWVVETETCAAGASRCVRVFRRWSTRRSAAGVGGWMHKLVCSQHIMWCLQQATSNSGGCSRALKEDAEKLRRGPKKHPA